MAKKSDNNDAKKARQKQKIVLVFGEDDNDRQAVSHLVKALWPDVPTIRCLRAPLVLIKGRANAEQRKSATNISKVVAAQEVTHAVRAVFAHEDCDAVEPAHVVLSKQIEDGLSLSGVPNPCAVTPAWEMEAWWFMWPDQVKEQCRQWRRPQRDGTNVGLIQNAKETLRREVRSTGKQTSRDYHESDGIDIAKRILDLGLVRDPKARSASFDMFVSRVDTISGRSSQAKEIRKGS